MALFSRRGRSDDSDRARADDADAVAEESSAVHAAPEDSVNQEPVPQVGISVSTFGAPVPAPSPAPAAPPARADEATAPSTDAGRLPENATLKSALTALPEAPQNIDVMNVMRQALQGTLFVRVRGDVKALVDAGEPITLAVTTIEDKRLLLAFTGPGALQDSLRSDGDTATSALPQPASVVFQNVVAGPYAGLFLDHATVGARVILPSELLAKALEEADPAFTLKTLLVSERTDATATAVVDALTRVKLWVAGNTDPSGQLGIAEARSADGRRRLEVFSHPLEVIALGRGDRPLPVTAAQLGKALQADPGITGVVVDPAGPWIEITRDQLGPVLALAG